MIDLTEQWEKGELIGEYWCEITESPYPEQVYLPTCDSDIIVKVLAPVPSYEEYMKLKELLKKCKRQFEEVELCRYDVADTDQEDWFKISTEQACIANKMITKIEEALK